MQFHCVEESLATRESVRESTNGKGRVIVYGFFDDADKR